jgi:hypothetical protein
MSEYQYYEFQAIDRRLTEKEQSQIDSLSSRVVLTPTQAIFNYSYGDFPADEEKILTKYFDAMLYLANWGRKRLMFRMPRSIIDAKQLSPYCVEDIITVSTTKDYVILDIDINEEEGMGWIEGEGILSSLTALRQDILNGDFRSLYLAWLNAAQLSADPESDEDWTEPPVPANLNKLNSPLKSFVELFEIDDNLIAVAAEASEKREDTVDLDFAKLIDKLTPKERNDFLLRLAKGEQHVGPQLLKRLQEFSAEEKPLRKSANLTGRNAFDLIKAAEERYKIEKEKKRKKAEQAKVRKLDKLAKEEPEVWKKVGALIEQKQTKAYDEAIKLLVDLRDLAKHLGKMDQFQASVRKIRNDYRHRSGLISRLQKVD